MTSVPAKNLIVKIVALILAMVLWVYVMNEQNPPLEASFSVPVETRGLSDGLLLSDVPDTVKVKVKGPRSVIAGISTKDIQCYIDLKDMREGTHNVRINAVIPQTLELVDISPDKAAVYIDVMTGRNFVVEVRMNGSPALGHIVSGSVSAPANVWVEGPKSKLDKVAKVIAVADVGGRDSNLTTKANLMAVDKDGRELRGLKIVPDAVEVTVNINRQNAKKLVPIRVAFTGNLPNGLLVKQAVVHPEQVELSADKNILDRLSVISTQPVNLGDISRDTMVDVHLQLPDGTAAVPDVVTVDISVEDKQQ